MNHPMGVAMPPDREFFENEKAQDTDEKGPEDAAWVEPHQRLRQKLEQRDAE